MLHPDLGPDGGRGGAEDVVGNIREKNRAGPWFLAPCWPAGHAVRPCVLSTEKQGTPKKLREETPGTHATASTGTRESSWASGWGPTAGSAGAHLVAQPVDRLHQRESILPLPANANLIQHTRTVGGVP